MIVIKKIYRWLIVAIIVLVALVLISIAITRFVIFPNINHYKQDISTKMTEKIGLKVNIGEIITDWDGISPRVLIRDLDILDNQNVSRIHLTNVRGTFSWLSIPLLHLQMSEILLKDIKLTIQRKKDGAIYVAGIALTGKGKPDLANWLLKQSALNIKNSTIVWQDELRQAPPLSLNKVNFTLSNPPISKLIGQSFFSASATPSSGTSKPVYINGSFFGSDLEQIKTWHGKAYLSISDADLTAWKTWIDYPFQINSGKGNTKVWLSFSKNKITDIKTNLALSDLSISKKNSVEPFNAIVFSGELKFSNYNNVKEFNAQHIKLLTAGSLNIDGGQVNFTQSIRDKEPWIKADLELKTFDLAAIQQIQTLKILPADIVENLEAIAPIGKLKNIALSWEGDQKKLLRYELKCQFNDLNINAYKSIPGFKNLTGSINANQDFGTLTLASNNTILDFKDVLRWPLPNNKIDGKVTWRHYGEDKIKITARDLAINNPHIQGILNATYDMNNIKGGSLDVSGKFSRGDIQYAPFYYPITLNTDTISWLDNSIKTGKAKDIVLTIKGNLTDFPYVTKQNKLNKNLGLFRVTAKISNAELVYGDSWPAIEGLGLDLLFEGNRMELNTNQGSILGNKITKCKTTIPNLNTVSPILTIVANTQGNMKEAIKFVNLSPVKDVALGFTDNLKTSGSGKLDLNVVIPLEQIDKSKYKGVYTVENGTLLTNADIGIPEISRLNGALTFTEAGLNIEKMTGAMLGGPADFNLKTGADGGINVNAKGMVSGKGISMFANNSSHESLTGYASSLPGRLKGNTNWAGQFSLANPLINFKISSNLQGLSINLPAPLGKSSEQETRFSIAKSQTIENKDQFLVVYGDIISAEILREEKNSVLSFSHGDIGLKTSAKATDAKGLTIHGQLDYLNADDWLAFFDETEKNNSNKRISNESLTITKADFNVNKLDIFSRSINQLNLSASPVDSGLNITISSQEIDGDVLWENTTNTTQSGKIIARLNNLIIPDANEIDDPKNETIIRKEKHYPDLDVIADNFVLGNKKLGKLTLNAFESNNSWVIKKLLISNPDDTLAADGVWHNWARKPNSFLNFSLSINNVGNTLERFGQDKVIKGKDANIAGQLQWPGSPQDFKTKGLNGNFKLDANKGQILKVKPGVGRLLGLLSLQSLPRRLTLDFRDLFSQGFAYDSISATATIENGILRSDNFFMTGPAAEVRIKGQTDLLKETQNLMVKVIPNISDSFSLAAFAGGAVTGVAAFVAQKLLKDPLNKIVQSEYRISGTWDNPQEVKNKQEVEKKPSLIN